MTESPFDVRLEVGRVLEAEAFPETRKDGMLKLVLDMGDREVRSCAQLAANYEPGELVGRQVLCATNLGTVNIAGFESQVLTVGVSDADGNPVVLAPDHEVPLGSVVH